MGKVEWSDLPEEVADLIANRVSSKIDLLRIRSICKPWRSAAVATKKRFPNRFGLDFHTLRGEKTVVIYPTAFFRVTHPFSSSPNKGWLIKTKQLSESSKNKNLFPLSRQLIRPCNKTLDLLKLGISEIRQSYEIHSFWLANTHQYFNDESLDDLNITSHDSSRVVLVDNLVLTIDYKKNIWCCKSRVWTRIKDEEVECFSDIIVHKGLIYALDLKGAIWLLKSSELKLFQCTPSTPKEYDDETYYNCKDKRLVDYSGDLCVVHRFCNKVCLYRADIIKTVKFKVYKMDEELVRWVEVSSLGDKALIVAPDSCFTVLASEYYGCLENAIYFTDNDGECKYGMKGEGVKVLKFDDGSIIISMIDSSSQSCFQMFSSPFL